MIKDYFENMQRELLDEKTGLEKQCMDVENRIREINKFVELLEEKNDPNYESFTPRDINARNKEKIKMLREERKILITDLEQYKQKLLANEVNVIQLMDIFQSIKEEEQKQSMILEDDRNITHEKRKILEYVSREKNDWLDFMQGEVLENLQSIYRKMKLVMQLSDVDANRSKMELRHLLPDIEKLVENLDDRINKNYITFENKKIESILAGYINIQEKKYGKKIEYISDNLKVELDKYEVIAVFEIAKELFENVIDRLNSLQIHTYSIENNFELKIVLIFNETGVMKDYIDGVESNDKLNTLIYLLQTEIKYEMKNEKELIAKLNIFNNIEQKCFT